MNIRKLLVISTLLSVFLAACGLKGPLYLPDGEEPAMELESETEAEDKDEAAA